MKHRRILEAALVASLVAEPVMAASYDGTHPFTCAPTSIVSCTPEAGCEKETAASINLPPVLSFDIAANKVTGTRPNGEPLAAAIDNIRHVQDNLAMQGVQGRVVWSVTVVEASGDMMLAAMGDRTGYIAFGTCKLG